MSIAEAADAVVAALEATGLRVAVRAGDMTPPCVYLQIGAAGGPGSNLAGTPVVTFWAFYVPVRGVDNLHGDAAALDAVLAALDPLAVADLAATRTSVTVGGDTWPAYRADLSTLALTLEAQR